MNKLTSKACAAIPAAAVLLAAALVLAGCGGSNSPGNALTAPDAGRGTLGVTINWPGPENRAIPQDTKSVVVTVVGAGTTAKTANRVAGESSVTLTFDNLAPGSKTVVADAFDGLDGTGSKVGTGQATATIENDKLAAATITIAELTNVDKLIAEGQKLLNEVIDMTPFDAALAKPKVQAAALKFGAAVLADPNNAQANFGLAITAAALAAQAMADKYTSVFAETTRSGGGSLLPLSGLTFWQMPQAIASGNDPVRAIVPSIGSTVGIIAGTNRGATAQDVVKMQTDIRNTILPIVNQVLAYLAVTESSSAFTFALGTFGSRDYVLVDVGDVYMFDAMLRGVKACLAIPAAYNLDYGTWDITVRLRDRDANGDGIVTRAEYLPPSPFGTLVDAAPMTALKGDIQTACDKIIAGIDATLAETKDEFDLIAWHTPGEGPTQQDLIDMKTVVREIRLTAAAPTLMPFPMGGWTIPAGLVKVYISAWSDNPPADLKVFGPEWELTTMPWGVEEKVKNGSLGDRTFGGIFPDGLAEDMLYEPETGGVDVTIK